MTKVDVAKLGKSVGLNGEIKIYLLSDFPEQFKKGAFFYLNSKKLVIQYYNKNSNIVKFEGINSKEEAQLLTNTILTKTIKETRENCKLKDGEYFWFDIIGLNVVENGEILGKIVDILEYFPNYFLEIAISKKLKSKKLPKTFLCPYVKDRYIMKVDLQNKTIFTKDVKELMTTQ